MSKNSRVYEPASICMPPMLAITVGCVGDCALGTGSAVFMGVALSPQMATKAIRIAQGTQASMVWPTVYGYSYSVGAAVGGWAAMAPGPTAPRPPATSMRSRRSRKRCLGCQTRKNSTTASTDTSPARTSVSRYVAAKPETVHCTTANTPPATRVAGQTSKASDHVPPSILTNTATSQNGTRIEANGSCRPAIADSSSAGRPDACDRPTIGLPIAPQATGAVLASRFSTADSKGAKPRPTIMAPAMATGVPKPLVPSMIAPNEKAISRHWSRRSKEMWVIDSLTISNFPVTRVIVYSSIAPMMIQMMPMNPFRKPATNDEMAEPTGMRITSRAITNAATTPEKAAQGALMPRCRLPSASRCGCRAMKYSSTRIGTAAASVDRT